MTHYSELLQTIENEVENEAAINICLADALFAEYKREEVEYSNPFINTGLQVGDIYVSTWGYEQTNVNFYQVIKVTAKTVTVREIEARLHETTGYLSRTVMPVRGAFKFNAVPIRRTFRTYQGLTCISINSYEGARNWDGKPQYATSYA
jgi:hypothetical protein